VGAIITTWYLNLLNYHEESLTSISTESIMADDDIEVVYTRDEFLFNMLTRIVYHLYEKRIADILAISS